MLLHRLLFRYLIRGEVLDLDEKEHKLVEYGFARFASKDGVRMDEPLAILAASSWFSAQKLSISNYVQDLVRDTFVRGHGCEDLLAAFFLQTFGNNCRVSDVFDFVTPCPRWAYQTAQLVSLRRFNDVLSSSRFSPSDISHVRLGTSARTYEDDLRWFEQTTMTPFLFPSNFMGPDLLFVLQLAKGEYLWVAVQSKYSSDALSDHDMEKAIRSVTPSAFYVDKVGYWLNMVYISADIVSHSMATITRSGPVQI